MGAEFIYVENSDGNIMGPVASRGKIYWEEDEIQTWLNSERKSREMGRPPRHLFKIVRANGAHWKWKREEIPVSSPDEQQSWLNWCTGGLCKRRKGGKRTKKTRRFKGKSKRTRKLKRTIRSSH
jgi:hypothetical protein